MLNPLARANPAQDHRLLRMQLLRHQRQNRRPQNLLLAIPKRPLRRLVPARDHPIQILAQNRIIGRLHNRRQPRPRNLQLPLVRYIPRNLRHPNHVLVAVPNRRDRQRHNNLPPILPHPLRLKVRDLLPSPHLAQNERLLVLQLRRNQLQNRLPNDLLRLIPENPRSRGIPARNDSIQVLRNNRVFGRMNNRLQQRGRSFHPKVARRINPLECIRKSMSQFSIPRTTRISTR